MKRCPKCGETKAATEFHARKRSGDGLQPWCKACNCAQIAQYIKDNPEWRKGHRQRRRAWELDATVAAFSVAEKLACYEVEYGAVACVYCGGPYEHDDHIVPLSRGGTHSLDNLAPSCRRCNSSKGAKSLATWLT